MGAKEAEVIRKRKEEEEKRKREGKGTVQTAPSDGILSRMYKYWTGTDEKK